jgi:hypothetical protein
MIRELGSYNASGTRTHVRFQFSTHAATGGNVAPSSAFEAADLRIYRANDSAAYSATQRSSAAGITMTSPFDSLTGVHDVAIDLTDNTDAGFYAAGYRYSVVLAPDETVDSQTITGVVLAEFEIGPPPANATQLAGQTITAAAGVTFPTSVASPTNITAGTITTVSGNVNGSVGSVTGAVGSVTGAVGSVTGSVGSVTGAVGSVTGLTASDVAAIKVITDALTAAAAAKLALSAGQIIPGTIDTTVAPSTTEFEADDITEATADHYNGRVVIFTSGVLAGQATSISDYALAGGKGHFTVVAMTEAPGNNDTFIIV